MLAARKPIATICASTFKTHKSVLVSGLARQQFRSVPLIRTMATNASNKHEFLIILPDKPGTLETRMKVRQQHLEKVTPYVQDQTVLLGGPLLEEHAPEGQPLKFHGSAMLVAASSAEEAVDFLKKDIYTTSGVWDWDKAQVFPFKSVVGRGV